jgi:hypothetical protein
MKLRKISAQYALGDEERESSYMLPSNILKFISEQLARQITKEIIEKELWVYEITPRPDMGAVVYGATVEIVDPNSQE